MMCPDNLFLRSLSVMERFPRSGIVELLSIPVSAGPLSRALQCVSSWLVHGWRSSLAQVCSCLPLWNCVHPPELLPLTCSVSYTILSVKQERILEELDDEARIQVIRGPRTGANSWLLTTGSTSWFTVKWLMCVIHRVPEKTGYQCMLFCFQTCNLS